jgi:hypothetical protein
LQLTLLRTKQRVNFKIYLKKTTLKNSSKKFEKRKGTRTRTLDVIKKVKKKMGEI